MPNNWLAERMDELIRAVDEIFVGKIPSEDDLYGIHQVLVERRDAELAHQSVMEMAVCPNCNGSGIYQEYDEYDRYHLHTCGTCGGSGEVDRQQESEG